MSHSIEQIAEFIGASIKGNPQHSILDVTSFDDAGPSDVTFASDKKFFSKIKHSKAGAILLTKEAFEACSTESNINFLICDNPKLSFFQLVNLFYPEKKSLPGIHPSAQLGKHVILSNAVTIGPNAVIGDNVSIGSGSQIKAGTYIGDDVSIGNQVIINPNVTILEKTQIGNQCIIHAGTVIGSDGFGFTQNDDQHEKQIHAGNVEILNKVEIGANCTIDRGTLGKTFIGNDVKIDNLVHIAHNVKIGDHTLIISQVGIAGSTAIKNNVIIAGKAGISGHLTIGAHSIVGPMAGVHSNVGEGEIVSGIPQMDHTRWRKVVSIISRLPEIRKQLFSFEKRLKNIEKKG